MIEPARTSCCETLPAVTSAFRVPMSLCKTSGAPSIPLLIGGILIAALAAPLLPDLIGDWRRNEDYSHGFLVPAVTAYLLWRRPGDWRWRELRPSWHGPVVVSAGVLLRVLAEVAMEQFTQRVSVLVVLMGLILSLWGWRGFKVWAFPVGYLLLMIPLPGVLYDTVSFPLRTFATQASAELIARLGIPVFRDGNVLHLARATLEVVDACSGIRSLISLLAVSGAVSYVLVDGWGPRLLLLAATVPVAFAANIIRLTGTAVLAERFGQQTADGFLHTLSGTAVFLLGTLAIVGIGRVLWRRGAR